MLPASPPALMVLVLLQGSGEPPSSATCEDVERVDLSLALGEVAREVCVSPGLMTGFLFDVPAAVELQDEVRFAEVIRGRSGVSFVPPKDMAPGERLRLTAHLGDGESQQSVTFTLVAHPGQATRQVEVYRDQRTRESYQQELAQEREKNQQLRAQLARAGGLRGLFLSGALGIDGIPVKQFNLGELRSGTLSLKRIITYRSKNSVAVEVWLTNSGTEPWTVEGASLVGTTGEQLEGVRIGQTEAIPPHQSRQVFIEADAVSEEPQGEVTLRVWGAERSISIPRVSFP